MLEKFGWMLMMTMILMIASILMLIIKFSSGERKYDVFVIEGNELTITSGIPRKYIIDDIERIVFSKKASRYALSDRNNWTGIIRIIKKSGLKTRHFLFDASSYHKKIVFESTESEIDLVTDDLMKQLRAHGIKCEKE